MHVLMHLEECTTSEVRVCGRKGTSYSLDVSGFRRIHWATGPHSKLGEIECLYILLFGKDQVTCHRGRIFFFFFFLHGRDLAEFEPRTFGIQGFPDGRSGCERT